MGFSLLLNGETIKERIKRDGKPHPSFFIDKGFIQIVGLPESGKTIFAHFLSQNFERQFWITRADSFSLSISYRLDVLNEEEIIGALTLLKDADVVCVIDPLSIYVFDERNRNAFFEKLRIFSSSIPIIFVNKYLYDDKKRFCRGNKKMWGGQKLRVSSDYIFSVEKINEYVEDEDIITKIKVDVIKSLDMVPESDIFLTFRNGLIE